MIKLTKSQKNKVYKHALKETLKEKKQGYTSFMCNNIEIAIWILKISNNFFCHVKDYNLHEFFKQKPKNTFSSCIWFKSDDYESRIKILRKCIKLTNPKSIIK